MRPDFIIYSTPSCKYCDEAKEILTRFGYTYEERDAREQEHNSFLKARSFKTVPQIYRPLLNTAPPRHIGGCDALKRYFGIE